MKEKIIEAKMEIEKNYPILKACRFCPMCRHLCTSGLLTNHESDFPRGRALIIYNIYKGEKYNEDYVNSIYNCTLCGSCRAGCEGNFNLPLLIKSAKQDIVNEGMEPEIARKMRQSIIENDNSFFIEKEKSFSNTLEFKNFVKNSKSENLYLMGQDINFINHEIAEAVIKIFTALKLNFTLLNEETHCGKVLSLLGYEEDAKKKAKILYEKILNSGCKRLIISDPLTFDCVKNDYPEWGLNLGSEMEIMHISQFLNEQINKKALTFKKSDKITMLADSEYLAKMNNIFDEPRNVINTVTGSKLVEPLLNKKEALATGEAAFIHNGEIFKFTEKLGEKICREARRINVQAVVTLSAIAKRNLKLCETQNIKTDNIEVMEISEFVAKYL
ncbi:MAG: (Fe-S)-binding protein [Actinobacteria bacterium]|nr:(Fe-S)-binding protein [Cyanobacteriota bacterium]MCL5772642.1 (Fe-S)-binding protein [Actinomycetota bacterium]